MVLGWGPALFFHMQMASFPRTVYRENCLSASTVLFDYWWFVVSFEIRKHESFNFVLFQGCFVYLGSLKIPYEF